MAKITVLGGIAFALILSLVGKVGLSALMILLPAVTAIKTVAVFLFGTYVLWLLAKSRLRNGKVIAFCLWCAISGATFLLGIPWLFFIAAQLALLWLLRSFCNYTSLLAASLDAAVIGAGTLAAIWAYTTTGSIFLTLWCFFLTQSLFVFIPKNGKSNNGQPKNGLPSATSAANKHQFQQACRSAETALLQLSKVNS